MTTLVRTISATLDGPTVTIADGTVRDRAIRIEAGAYATPFWVQTGDGKTLRVNSLPWQGVVEAGSVKVRSTDPTITGGANEPSDYDSLIGRKFDSKATTSGDRGTGNFPWKTGGSEGYDDHERLETNITIVTDNGAPISPSNVMQFHYPQGSQFGLTPGQVQTRIFGQHSDAGVGTPIELSEIYARIIFKLGSNFQLNPNSNTHKMVFFKQDGAELTNGPVLIWRDVGGDIRFQWNMQDTEEAASDRTETTAHDITLDTWYETEVKLVLNSAVGTADGEIQQWIREYPSGSPINIHNHTDVLHRPTGDTGAGNWWRDVRFDPINGGQVTGSVDPAYSWWLDHVWISGKE